MLQDLTPFLPLCLGVTGNDLLLLLLNQNLIDLPRIQLRLINNLVVANGSENSGVEGRLDGGLAVEDLFLLLDDEGLALGAVLFLSVETDFVGDGLLQLIDEQPIRLRHIRPQQISEQQRLKILLRILLDRLDNRRRMVDRQ